MDESEYIRCEKCKRLFLQSDDNCCPYCGKRISGAAAENVEKPPLIARQINGKMFAVLIVIVVINIIAALISMLSNISVYSAAESVGSEEFKLVRQYVESGMITDTKTVESVQLVIRSFNAASVLVWFICMPTVLRLWRACLCWRVSDGRSGWELSWRYSVYLCSLRTRYAVWQ